MTGTLDIAIHKTEQSRISQVDFDNISFGKEYSDHMFVADFKNGQWSDLRIVPFGHLKISPANAALHYGQSIFEGMKAYRNAEGRPLIFRPEMNARRFNRSAVRMCMPEIPEEIFIGGLAKLVDLDKDWIPSKPGTSLYLRPFMFAADEYIGVRPSQTYKFMIFTCPVGGYYSKPVRVKVETKFVRAAEGGTGAAKTAGNYAASLYPAQLAVKEGYDQLIWTDAKTHTFIEEAGTMNFMFVIDGKLVTPPTSGSILEGVTRHSILELASDWGMVVEERPVKVQEVIEAIKSGRLQEAFGAGTAATVAHIEAIGHEGTDYELPPIESREFSNKVLKEMEALKRGEIEDRFGWIYKV
ncbi:MAG: branched-chain amino acid aminotransferase [Cyclobacteriaceae bacterium]